MKKDIVCEENYNIWSSIRGDSFFLFLGSHLVCLLMLGCTEFMPKSKRGKTALSKTSDWVSGSCPSFQSQFRMQEAQTRLDEFWALGFQLFKLESLDWCFPCALSFALSCHPCACCFAVQFFGLSLCFVFRKTCWCGADVTWLHLTFSPFFHFVAKVKTNWIKRKHSEFWIIGSVAFWKTWWNLNLILRNSLILHNSERFLHRWKFTLFCGSVHKP